MGKETMYRKVISTTGSFTYEPVTGYFFTEEQMKEHDREVAGKAWDAAMELMEELDQYPYGRRGGYQKPDKKTYLDNLLK